jgi:hypothetical protein
MTIANNAVLVTGANRGIGQALVQEALRRGSKQVYAGTRQPLASQPQVAAVHETTKGDPLFVREVVRLLAALEWLGQAVPIPGTIRAVIDRQLVPLSSDAVQVLSAAAIAVAEAAEPEAARNLFRREGEYWTISYEGAVARLRDAKGLRHLARLLARPGQEFHAVDLEAAESQPGQVTPVAPRGRAGNGELMVRRDLGDAGALLDATAKAAYQARLGELRAELEEAEGFNDPARATKARQEMDFLVAELARAVGLGGRDRRAAAHAERARLNVTRAIRAAMANLAEANPALGRHLASTVHTGRYCSYTPDPRVPITWER